MNYYKYLDIDNFNLIKDKTSIFIKDENVKKHISYGFNLLNWNNYKSFFPEISNSFQKYNMYPVQAALYITAEQKHSKIHIDYKDKKTHLCRVNIPIKNCEGSKTEFYSGGKYSEITQTNGLKYLEIDEDDDTAVKVAEVEIIKPTVIRIQEPHRVNTNTNKVPRICMTLFMNIDPVFLLED